MNAIGRGVVVAVVIAVLAWLAWQRMRPHETPIPPDVRADSTDSGFKAARVFFASPSGDSLVAEAHEMMATETVPDRVRALVDELARGPSGRALRTLPVGTAVQHVYLDEHGLLTLDLTRAFHDGFRGGSTAEYLAIASLARTLSANVPEARRIMLVCGGQPITTLGGHLPLDRPIDPSDLP